MKSTLGVIRYIIFQRELFKMNKLISISALLYLIPSLSSASSQGVKRLSSIYKDLGKVEKIYLHAGLITVVEFPAPLLEVRLGNTKSIRVEISQVSPKELTLFLMKDGVSPTNLIVRSNQKIYVFDVIPSKVSHQDYIKISGGFGAPELVVRRIEDTKASSETKSAKKQQLIKSIKIGG